MKQRDGESCQNYVTRLCEQSKFCSLKCPNCEHSLEDEKLLEVFLKNTSISAVRTKCFERNLSSLSDLLILAKDHESSRKESDAMTQKQQFQNVSPASEKRHPPKRKSKPQDHLRSCSSPKLFTDSSQAPEGNIGKRKCKFCARFHVLQKKFCPAWGKTCEKCSRPNHFKSCCTSRINVSSISDQKLSHGFNYEFCYTVGTPEKVYADLFVNGIRRTFQLDSGASKSIIPPSFLDSSATLESASSITAAGGIVLRPRGKVWLKVGTSKQNAVLREFLVLDNQTPLLSLACCLEFNLIKLNSKLVHSERQSPAQCSALKDLLPGIENVDSRLRNLILEYQDIFAPELGCVKGVKAKIQLKNNAVPKFRRARPVPLALLSKVKDTLRDMIEKGTLEPVRTSEWASPMVTVAKPDKSVRLCADYTSTLADQIDTEAYPLPHPDEIFSKLAGNKIFSKLDLRCCFEQFELDETSKDLLTVNTVLGLLRYNRLPRMASVPAQLLFNGLWNGCSKENCYLRKLYKSSLMTYSVLLLTWRVTFLYCRRYFKSFANQTFV